MSEKKPGPKILLPSSSPLVVLTKFFSSHDEGYIWMQPNRIKKKIIYFFSYWKKTYIICYNFNYQLFLVFFISWSQCISNHISAVVSLLTGHSCQRPPLIIRPDFRYTDSKLLLYFPLKRGHTSYKSTFFHCSRGGLIREVLLPDRYEIVKLGCLYTKVFKKLGISDG
jgi:hypothetical protein